MNKKLENLFNLPEVESEPLTAEETQTEIMELRSTLDMSKRIDAAVLVSKYLNSMRRGQSVVF